MSASATMGLIARGLLWYHWKIYLNDEVHSVVVKTVMAPGVAYLNEAVFGREVRNRVKETIAGDVLRYEGVQGVDDPTLSAWRFSIYGELMVGDDASRSDRRASDFVVITGPKAMFHKIEEETARARA